jgi:hypothetical protein
MHILLIGLGGIEPVYMQGAVFNIVARAAAKEGEIVKSLEPVWHLNREIILTVTHFKRSHPRRASHDQHYKQALARQPDNVLKMPKLAVHPDSPWS